MKIFISWSGNKSKQVALLLKEWLGSVIQAAKPWVSDKDIDRGAQWFTEISNILTDCKIGIVCLTEENKNNPWILFESGALVKGLNENRLCTFLIDLKPTDIQPPLSQFNHTEATKESLFNLVKTINDSAGENKLADGVLNNVFETFFPSFKSKFQQILAETPSSKQKQTKNQAELLEEVLLTVRNIEKESYGRDAKMIDIMKAFIGNQKDANEFFFRRYKQELEDRITVETSKSEGMGLQRGSGISALDKIRKQYAAKQQKEQPPLNTGSTEDDDLPF